MTSGQHFSLDSVSARQYAQNSSVIENNYSAVCFYSTSKYLATSRGAEYCVQHVYLEGLLACKKLEWWDAGVVISLERGADLHMAQLMPLPLTISCSSESRLVLPSWFYLSGTGSLG